MWYGGNNLARWAAASITNMYADGVNFHADLTPNEPKHSHLTALHQILAEYNDVLMGEATQINNPLPVNLTMALNVAPCSSSNVHQNISFVNGRIQASNGYCLVGTCGNNCYPAVFAPCSSSKDQQFTFNSNKAFVNEESYYCLDVYESSGPSVGLYGCTDAPNQAWTINAQSSTIQSQIANSPCMTGLESVFSIAYVYQSPTNASRSLTFLYNNCTSNLTAEYNGHEFFVPAGSISLIDGSGTELYNTFKVNTANVPTERVYQVRFDAPISLVDLYLYLLPCLPGSFFPHFVSEHNWPRSASLVLLVGAASHLAGPIRAIGCST
jgi:hypothetical protein